MTMQRTTRDRVREMDLAGMSPRQISLLLGISTQMVYRHLARIKVEDAEDFVTTPLKKATSA